MNAPLDDLVRQALHAFADDLSGRTWLAKELDCVNRFVFRHLARCVRPGGPLNDLGQIRIEGNTPQPPGIGSKVSARKDLVIWADPDATCFHDPRGDGRWLAPHTPLAIIEWKADLRAQKRPRLNAHDLNWLGAAARHWPAFTGYAVLLHRDVLMAARCYGHACDREWLTIPRRTVGGRES